MTQQQDKGLVLILDENSWYHRIPKEILEEDYGYATESHNYCDLEDALKKAKKYRGAILWLGPAIREVINRTIETVEIINKYDSSIPIVAFASTTERERETGDYRRSLGEKALVIAYGEFSISAKQRIKEIDAFFKQRIK